MVRSRSRLGRRARPVSGESNLKRAPPCWKTVGDADVGRMERFVSLEFYFALLCRAKLLAGVVAASLDEIVVEVQNGAKNSAEKKSKPYPLITNKCYRTKKPKSELGIKIKSKRKTYINNYDKYSTSC